MACSRSVVAVALAGGAVMAASQPARAGVVYTDPISFSAAVAGLSPSWGEDFEGFGVGPVASPTIVGGGAGQISVAPGGMPEILSAGPVGTGNVWIEGVGGFGERIEGPAESSLGVSAISFDFFSQFEGMYNFNHSGGVDSAAMTPAGAPRFVGWVGGAGETLHFVDYTPGTSSHIIDNIAAFVPAPGSLALLGAGALAGMRRRREGRSGDRRRSDS